MCIVFLSAGIGASWAEPTVSSASLGAPGFQPSREHPVGWRGDLTGCFPGATPVLEWDAASGKNILWKEPMPNWSNGGVIVVGGRVLTLAEPQTLLCHDAVTGKRLWFNNEDVFDVHHKGDAAKADEERQLWAKVERTYGMGRDSYNRLNVEKMSDETKAERQKAIDELKALGVPMTKEGEPDPYAARWMDRGLVRNHYGSSMGRTQCTPVSDGKSVWVAWGNNTVGSYDLQTGKTRWLIFAGPIRRQFKGYMCHTTGCSFTPAPFLVEDKFLVMHNRYLTAYDPDNGKQLWQLDTDYGAPQNSHNGAGTFVPMKLGQTTVVVTPFGWVVRVSDGKLLCDTKVNADIGGNSPVADDATDVIFLTDFKTGGGNSSQKTYAVKLTLAADGTVVANTVWTSPVGCIDGSPVFHGGRLYVCPERGMVVLNGGTGETVANTGALNDFRTGYQSLSLVKGHILSLGGRQAAVLDASGVVTGGVGNGSFKEPDDTPVRNWREVAFKEGVIKWIDTAPTHGGWVNSLYGNLPFFDGERMYVRSRAYLYCVGPK
jgi:outer membrane protein assembly factor BamB